MKNFAVCAAVVLVALASCTKKSAEEDQEPEVYGFMDTNQVVQKDDISLIRERFVEVDFNRDGKMDLAVVEAYADAETELVPDAEAPAGGSDSNSAPVPEKLKKKKVGLLKRLSGKAPPRTQLTLYIQESAGYYYLGGKIVDEAVADIIGLAYRRNALEFFDLVLAYEYGNGHTEVVQYVNDGETFQRMGKQDQ